MAKKVDADVTINGRKVNGEPKKAPQKIVVDSTAVEIPAKDEEVTQEPEVEAEKINDETIFDCIANRYNASDAEKEIASKVFHNTKEGIKDSFSEENATIIAAAATDAVLLSMINIIKEEQHQQKVEYLMKNYYTEREAERLARREARAEARDKRRQQRYERREERRDARQARRDHRNLGIR